MKDLLAARVRRRCPPPRKKFKKYILAGTAPPRHLHCTQVSGSEGLRPVLNSTQRVRSRGWRTRPLS